MKYDLSDTRSYLSKENSCLTNVTEVEPEHNDGTYMKIIRNIFWDDLGKPKYIYNKLFETTSCLPDGLGTRIFTQQVKSASEEGFKYIETYAGRGGIYKGYHIWPKLGYNAKVIFDLDSYIDSDLVALGKYLKKWLEKNSNSYTASKGNSFSANILDVYACKAGKRFVGQELWKFIGESTDMKFDLNPSSLSMRILETYVTLKAKKEGTVAACNVILAIQPKVSALILLNLFVIKSIITTKKLFKMYFKWSNGFTLLFIFYSYKKYDYQF